MAADTITLTVTIPRWRGRAVDLYFKLLLGLAWLRLLSPDRAIERAESAARWMVRGVKVR